MDPISLIIAALAAGAIAGVKDTAGQAVTGTPRRRSINRNSNPAPVRRNLLSICALRAQPMMKS